MGETIRYLMVATVAIISVVETAQAQGPGSFQFPQSLSGAGGQTGGSTGQSPSAPTNPVSSALQLPGFTGGVDDRRASPRPGGPTTDPTARRDSNSWMTDPAQSGGARPSTDPFPANAASTAPSNQLSPLLQSQLRGGSSAGGPAQSPQSGGAQPTSRSTGAPPAAGSTGFGSLPDGVRLPERPAQGNRSTGFGSGFALGSTPNNPNAANPNMASGTQFGPKTASEANFDPSIYNNGRTSQSQAGRQDQSTRTAQQDLVLTGNFGGASPTNARGASGSGLGLPAPPSRQADTSPPTNWTSDQIAALGAKFNLPPTDPRLRDQAFVNDLYSRWREHQASQPGASQAAAGQNSRATNSAATPWGTTPTASGGRSPVDLTQYQPHGPQSNGRNPQLSSPSELLSSDPRSTHRTQIVPTKSLQAGGLSRRKPLYDSFGNRVDADGNILDATGKPVDDATAYDLTYGKKLREDMAHIAKEHAELEKQKLQQSFGTPPSRIATGFPSSAGGQQPANQTGIDRHIAGTSNKAQVRRPSTSDSDGLLGDRGRGTEADQAGFAGASKAIGRSNPYVNVFLLCSLVANAFLFISLHRLWYHHRDLIASSRMAASGISSNE